MSDVYRTILKDQPYVVPARLIGVRLLMAPPRILWQHNKEGTNYLTSKSTNGQGECPTSCSQAL